MNRDEFANHDAQDNVHDDANDPDNHREADGSGSADGYDDAAGNGEVTTPGSLEDILERHLGDVEAEHALLLSMWNAPAAGNRSRPETGSELQTTPGHVTVLHQARALTAGDLRAALIGIPDDQPVAIDVPLDPGGLVLHRYVLTSTAAAVLLLADEDEVLDPSLVLRGDFPTGVYEIPTGDAPAGDPSSRTQ